MSRFSPEQLADVRGAVTGNVLTLDKAKQRATWTAPAAPAPTAHAASHLPDGSDALTTAVAGASAPGDAAAVGTALSFARADHRHSREALLKLDDCGAPDDNTDLNASAAAHGLLRKLSGTSTQYLGGDGNWSVPAGSGGATHALVRKTVDEAVTSSTVVQDDDALAFTFGTSETWLFEFVLFVNGDAAGDFACIIAGRPVGATAAVGGYGPGSGATFDTTAPEATTATPIEVYGASGLTTTRNFGLAGTGFPVTILLKGWITSTSTGGTLTLQWAQRVSSATATTVMTGSHLIAHRV